MDFEIIDVEKTEDKENNDRVRGYRELHQEWIGKIKWGKYDFKFKSTNIATTDNGGFGTEITSEKPKEISDDEWEELETEMQEFVGEEFRKNRSDWESAF